MNSQRIIVGVDGSVGARGALEWAVDECRIRGCTLVIVHAVDSRDTGPGLARPSGDYDGVGERLLSRDAAAASGSQPSVPVTTLLSNDPPADTLIDLSGDAQLVVVGTRGSRSVTSAILGSVSRRTAMHAQCPVAVVPRRPSPSVDDRAACRVVVCVSAAHDCRLALEFARHEAELRGARLQSIRADVEPAEALLRAAQGAQLLVLGCHKSDERWSTRLGSVPSSLVHRSPCPVVMVSDMPHGGHLAASGLTVRSAARRQAERLCRREVSTGRLSV